jgi:hypothetical protein
MSSHNRLRYQTGRTQTGYQVLYCLNQKNGGAITGQRASGFAAQVMVILRPSAGFLSELRAGIPLIKREEMQCLSLC